ncbi:MAG: hypothetical protein RLZZ09_956 [Pseudomonadota bacterium]|jgi:hypothetical protein
MYDIRAFATDDADWALRVDLIDDTTGAALDTTGCDFSMAISEREYVLFTGTNADGTIEVPQTGTIQWRLTPDDLGSLEPGNTYSFGVTMTSATGTTQLLLGTLAYVDGSAQ